MEQHYSFQPKATVPLRTVNEKLMRVYEKSFKLIQDLNPQSAFCEDDQSELVRSMEVVKLQLEQSESKPSIISQIASKDVIVRNKEGENRCQILTQE